MSISDLSENKVSFNICCQHSLVRHYMTSCVKWEFLCGSFLDVKELNMINCNSAGMCVISKRFVTTQVLTKLVLESPSFPTLHQNLMPHPLAHELHHKLTWQKSKGLHCPEGFRACRLSISFPSVGTAQWKKSYTPATPWEENENLQHFYQDSEWGKKPQTFEFVILMAPSLNNLVCTQGTVN